jgi:hypothetical protein
MRRNAGGISDDGFSRLAWFVRAKEEDEPEKEEDSEDTSEDESDDPDIKGEVIQFLKDNPDPEDEEFHEWAEENGYNIHEVEDIMYQLATDHVEEGSDEEDQLQGGRADDVPDEDLPMEQLLKGIKVEMEHTDDEDLAKEIATDHLEEFDDYYDALAEMEDDLRKKGQGRGGEDAPTSRWVPEVAKDGPYEGYASCADCGQDVLPEYLSEEGLCDVCSRRPWNRKTQE